MKFIVLLMVAYVYFFAALVDSFKNISYQEPQMQQTLVIAPAAPEKPVVAKVAMAKTASFVEKSGYPL